MRVEHKALEEIATAVRTSPERAGTALFVGDAHEATRAAAALAERLGLTLHRVDLGAVVGKYIGETEKNLDQVFASARESGALLLFDEADALFGKRSEVKDSHDRYANAEIDSLLKRMEAYAGLAILATNSREAADTLRSRLRLWSSSPDGPAGNRSRAYEVTTAWFAGGATARPPIPL